MHRLRSIDSTTSTIRAQLFAGEDIIVQQPGVGLYDGKEKDHRYKDGILFLTSHRLIYIDAYDPHRHSCFLDLSCVRQTEFWVGFLKSSPKITLLLGDPAQTSGQQVGAHVNNQPQNSYLSEISIHSAVSHWACHVCAFSNPPGSKCGLCGVPRQTAATRPSSNRPSKSSAGNYFSSPRVNAALAAKPNSIQAEQQTARTEIACPTCTYLNHPTMSRCEMCDSVLETLDSRDSLSNQVNGFDFKYEEPAGSILLHSQATTPTPPASFPPNSYIRLSFRRGGDKAFYLSLKKVLQAKSWEKFIRESSSLSSSSALSAVIPINSKEPTAKVGKAIGIDGIMKTMDYNHQANRTELADGLEDLKTLMSKAKDMVQLARAINAKLTASEISSRFSHELEPIQQNAGTIRSSLVKLGLPTPAVTSDMLASDQAYEEELAKELACFISRTNTQQFALDRCGFQFSKSIQSLDEVWCMWNRARGILPVSPADMLAACQHLPKYSNPQMQLHTFRSGLKVIHSPYFSPIEFGARTLTRLYDSKNGTEIRPQPLTTLQIAQVEGLPVSLARELLETVEDSSTGSIVRDLDTSTGIVRWYPNLILGYRWTA